MGIGKILNNLLKEKGIRPSELAKRVGATPSTIDSIIKRDNSKVQITLLNDICKELGVSPELFFDDFAKRNSSDDLTDHSERIHLKKYRSLDEYGKRTVDSVLDIEFERCSSESSVIDLTIELPMPELPASAGTGTWLEDGYNTPVTVRRTKEAERANVVIRVSGDSMEPMFSDSDCVLVRIQPDVEPGEIGIFIVDNEGYIKKKGSHELISVNPEYDNIPISEYTECRCFGKVLGKAEIIE